MVFPCRNRDLCNVCIRNLVMSFCGALRTFVARFTKVRYADLADVRSIWDVYLNKPMLGNEARLF